MPLQYQQQKKRFNGITDDRFLGEGFVGDADGVSLRTQSRGVFLANNKEQSVVVDVSGLNSSNSIYRINTLLTATKTVGPIEKKVYGVYETGVCNTENGSLYPVSGLSGARNAIIVKSAGVNYGAVLRNTTSGALFRWNDDTQSITNMTNYMNLSYTSEYRPLLDGGGFLYVGGNGAVEAIDISTSTWVVAYTVSIPGDCRGLTQIGDQIYIYSNDGNNGYKMSWDGVSAFPQYLQKRADNPVLNVANIGNYDYVICGVGEPPNMKYRRLWKSVGFEKGLLFGGDYVERDDSLFHFSPIHTNAIETARNVSYIPGRGSIYTYGSERSSLPDSLSKDILPNDCKQVTAMYFDGANDMYVSYYTNSLGISKISKFDMRPGRGYGTQGYVTTLTFDGGDIETEKINNRIIVNYRLAGKPTVPTGTTSIDLYARINGDESRVFNSSIDMSTVVLGDKYIRDGREYTIIEKTVNGEIICSRQENGPYNSAIINVSGTLTRSYGAGPSTIAFTNVSNYIFIKTINDVNKRKEKIPFSRKRYTIDFKAVLKSTYETITPELYSIKTLFDYVDLDNG